MEPWRQGGRETGQALSALVRIPTCLLFTGSANTGYQLHRQLSGSAGGLCLEMGGTIRGMIDEVADIYWRLSI